jgi:hypothetical protein
MPIRVFPFPYPVRFSLVPAYCNSLNSVALEALVFAASGTRNSITDSLCDTADCPSETFGRLAHGASDSGYRAVEAVSKTLRKEHVRHVRHGRV